MIILCSFPDLHILALLNALHLPIPDLHILALLNALRLPISFPITYIIKDKSDYGD